MKSPTRPKRRPGVVRRSFALPVALVEQVSEAAPPEYRGNLNALVRTALEEYVAKRARDELERSLDAMAADPALRAASADLFLAGESADSEGLPRP